VRGSTIRPPLATAVLAGILGSLGVCPALAQELEPGLYFSSPIGVNAAIVGYMYSSGNILMDPSLPIEGAHAQIHTANMAFIRSFGLLGKTAKVDAQVPIAAGDFEGYVAGEFRNREPSGPADPRLRVLVNFIGAPALRKAEFAAQHPGTIVGVSFQAVFPWGRYDPSRLINLGSNRWSFRPELGVSRAQGKWHFELSTGVWLFTDNHENYGGTTLEQSALPFVKGDVMYTFKRGMWVAANYGVANGGETRVDGGPSSEIQTNQRVGATFAYPFGRSLGAKLVYTSGLTTRIGADFDSYGASMQYTWGG